jgi:repressor LexA
MKSGDKMESRIRMLRKEKRMTMKQLGKIVGVAESTISQYETGKRQPDYNVLCGIAEFFGVSVDYLLGRQDYPDAPKSTGGVWVPVLGRVAAGIPIEAVEDIEDYEEISLEMAGTGEHFALKIRGDSMEPKISNGDVVIVRKQDNCDNGSTAVVLVNGQDATVKKIKKSPEGLMLIPTNPSYEPIFYSNVEIQKLPVRILGKVVELRAKF